MPATSPVPTGWPTLVELQPVSEASLLEDMVDPSVLLDAPNPPYVASMASSWDRGAAGGPDSAGWFANRDSGFFEGVEGNESILLDVDGPGALTRIWSANPMGTIRIYFDGSTTPSIEEDLRDFLHGNVAPFTTPFGFVVSYGYNLYYPFPFASGCKVTVEVPEGHRLFYQINVRKYADEAVVQTYGTTDAELETARQTARTALESGLPETAGTTVSASLDQVPLEITGSGVIRSFRISAPLSDDELRQTVLLMSFDGEETVRVPLGDFFGTGPGLNASETLMTTTTETGEMIMRWPMPFESSVSVRIEGSTSVPVLAEADWEPRTNTVSTLRFHAHYRAPADIPTLDAEGLPTPIDWNLADLQGRGFLVGILLNVANDSPIWWGEGDEKIWVDGESFPSYFGTGTEDFFGYAWCSTEIFSEPFVAQTRARRTDNAGNVSLLRWLLSDAIPFTESLRFDLETLHGHDMDGPPFSTTFDAVTYYYAEPGAMDTHPPFDASTLRVPQPTVGIEEGRNRTCGRGFIPPDP